MSAVLGALAAVGGAVLFLLKVLGILLAVLLAAAVLVLLCPFCADFAWEGPAEGEDGPGEVKVRAGALGLTFPVFQYPKPAPPPPAEEATAGGSRSGPFRRWLARLKEKAAARRAARKAKKVARKPAQAAPAAPRQKGKLTLHILCTLLQGAGRLTRAVFGALRVTRIRVRLPVGEGEPDAAARAYGETNAWLYPALGVLDHFIYLDFEELRLVPCIDPAAPRPRGRISFRVTARVLFIVIAAAQILIAFYREKVLDVFL